LAWGHYDSHNPDQYAVIAAQERHAIRALLQILEEFEITATWGLVGHLFHSKCEECEVCPIMEWKGKYPAFDQIRHSDPDWYGLEAVELLLKHGSRHEIAFHGYTHRAFDEIGFTREDANTEIREWMRVARTRQVVPTAVIFPRNRVGHLEVFSEAGFTCYRGPLLTTRICALPVVGKVFRLADLHLQLAIPEVYDPKVTPSGLVNLPSSRRLLGKQRTIQGFLDSLGLHNLGIKRILRGVDRAAREGKVIHIASHPYEFCNRHDFHRLRFLLSHVAEHVKSGRLRSIGMSDLAAISIARVASRLNTTA
jgi:hypothetical protein